MHHRSAIVTAATLASMAGLATAQDGQSPHAGMLRYPDVSRDQIVFVYGGDLWTVPKMGGVATSLASPPGSVRTGRRSCFRATTTVTGICTGWSLRVAHRNG